MSDDGLTAQAYTIYRWDCPSCGEVNETGDADPDDVETCEGCGAEVEVTT